MRICFQDILDSHWKQEIIYRVIGFLLCAASGIIKFINVSHPDSQDGLLKPSTNHLEEIENPFFLSMINNYQARPEELADFCHNKFSSLFTILSNKSNSVQLENSDASGEKLFNTTWRREMMKSWSMAWGSSLFQTFLKWRGWDSLSSHEINWLPLWRQFHHHEENHEKIEANNELIVHIKLAFMRLRRSKSMWIKLAVMNLPDWRNKY